MNWFERYGISGSYFVVLVIAWFFAFTYEANTNLWTVEKIKILAGVGAGVFVPIGYIISIFAQFLYYAPYNLIIFWPFFNPIHRKVIKHFPERSDLHNQPEWKIEAETSVSSRLTGMIDSCDLERFKWISETMTKRWNVVAINQIFIVATLIAPVLSILLVWLVPEFNYKINNPLFSLVLIISIIALVILMLNKYILEKQLIIMYRLIYTNFSSLLKKTTRSDVTRHS